MYSQFSYRNMRADRGRRGQFVPGEQLYTQGYMGDYIGLVRPGEKRVGIPGKRIIFAGRRRSRRMSGSDFEFDLKNHGKALTPKSMTVVTAKKTKPKRKSAVKKTAKKITYKPVAKKANRAKRQHALKVTATQPLPKGNNLKDYKLIVQVNPRIKHRQGGHGEITNKCIGSQGWTKRKAQKVARELGFTSEQVKSMVKVSGKRRKRRAKAKRLFGTVVTLAGRRRKRRTLRGNVVQLAGKRRKRRTLRGNVVAIKGKKRRKATQKRMRALYGKKRRYARVPRRMRGFADDKPTLIIGLGLGGGIAVLLHRMWQNNGWNYKLPTNLQDKGNEVFALAMILTGVLLSFADKIGAVKSKPKLANGLKAAGIGLSVGAIGMFAKEKIGSPSAPAVSGRHSLRGVVNRQLAGRAAMRGIPNLQADRFGVGALGMRGRHMAGSVVALPEADTFRRDRAIATRPFALRGAANLEASNQTGLTAAEYGL